MSFASEEGLFQFVRESLTTANLILQFESSGQNQFCKVNKASSSSVLL